MTRELDLPPVQSTILDLDTLASLFDDLAHGAEILSVLVKPRAAAYATGPEVTLRQAQELLTAGETRGVQLRYRHENKLWSDTLMVTAEGIRLVRCPLEGGHLAHPAKSPVAGDHARDGASPIEGDPVARAAESPPARG